MSLPRLAEVLANSVPTSCIPSPLSPQKPMVACDRSTTGLSGADCIHAPYREAGNQRPRRGGPGVPRARKGDGPRDAEAARPESYCHRTPAGGAGQRFLRGNIAILLPVRPSRSLPGGGPPGGIPSFPGGARERGGEEVLRSGVGKAPRAAPVRGDLHATPAQPSPKRRPRLL